MARFMLRLSDPVQTGMELLARGHDRSINKEIEQACKAWTERESEKEMSEHHRPCIISIGVAPGADWKASLKELHELFSYVDGAPQKGEFQVLCAGPLHGLSYDEAFILCQKKFFEVGWVYADTVQK